MFYPETWLLHSVFVIACGSCMAAKVMEIEQQLLPVTDGNTLEKVIDPLLMQDKLAIPPWNPGNLHLQRRSRSVGTRR